MASPAHQPLDPPAPNHVAIIMDGNGRWAQARGLPRVAGHKRGAESVRVAVKACIAQGVRYLTLFGFSTENWKRPAAEVSELMGILRFYLKREAKELHANGVRLAVIGDRSAFSKDIQTVIAEAEALTAGNQVLTLTLALNYGGRQEILDACRALMEEAKSGETAPEDLNESVFEQRMYGADTPDPDLLIRTSGEQRISNFLLWQCAYAEFYFTPTHWPDFSAETLAEAIETFHGRDRRFGGVTP